jgi:hypothetical protein
MDAGQDNVLRLIPTTPHTRRDVLLEKPAKVVADVTGRVFRPRKRDYDVEIQHAIDAVVADGGGTVLIKQAGTYSLSAGLKRPHSAQPSPPFDPKRGHRWRRGNTACCGVCGQHPAGIGDARRGAQQPIGLRLPTDLAARSTGPGRPVTDLHRDHGDLVTRCLVRTHRSTMRCASSTASHLTISSLSAWAPMVRPVRP